MSRIHPTAIIEPGATIAYSAEIGPYCIVGSKVELKDRAQLLSHVVVAGNTVIGEGTVIHSFAAIGTPPQDLKYKGEPSRLVIGARNIIREHVTINPGTEGGGMETRIGDDCLLMVGVHIGHDCRIGNRVIMANNATLAGHVTLGDQVLIGGLSAVHQFVRVGVHAVIGGMTGVEHDVIPYGSVMGERGHLAGLNLVGMKRGKMERETIHALRNAYKLIFEQAEGTLAERVENVAHQFSGTRAVMEMVEFIRGESKRQFLVPAQGS